MKICYIAGAYYENNDICPLPTNDDILIAADGGYKFLNAHNLTPDYIMGDFDSLGYIPKEQNTTVFPSEKDDTDMNIAYFKGKSLGYKNFVLLGGMGGRYDHLYSNFQLLTKISKDGGRALLVGGGRAVTAISNSSITIPASKKGFISVFSASDASSGVTIKGLKYTADNITLTNDYPLGVSNEFIGSDARISVKNGSLIIMWYEGYNSLQKGFSTLFLK